MEIGRREIRKIRRSIPKHSSAQRTFNYNHSQPKRKSFFPTRNSSLSARKRFLLWNGFFLAFINSLCSLGLLEWLEFLCCGKREICRTFKSLRINFFKQTDKLIPFKTLLFWCANPSFLKFHHFLRVEVENLSPFLSLFVSLKKKTTNSEFSQKNSFLRFFLYHFLQKVVGKKKKQFFTDHKNQKKGDLFSTKIASSLQTQANSFIKKEN